MGCVLKYFISWVAFMLIITICFPLCFFFINRILTGDIVKNDSTGLNVYFVNEDKVKPMNTESYILGVVMAEMPASFELEALKAQSVAARTYLYEKLFSKVTNPEHKGGDICTDPSHCQAYISVEEAKEKWGKNASFYFRKCKKAVEATRGIVAQYENKPIKAVFHAYASGKTENAKDVWGSDVAYLKSVDSPGDKSAPEFLGTCTIEISEFKRIATEKFGCDFKNGLIGEVKYTPGGSVDVIQIGDKLVKGTKIREAFSLKSACFKINTDGDSLIFEVKGYGHGVGMSQYGANHCAKAGMTYDEILKKYYTGIELKKMNFNQE